MGGILWLWTMPGLHVGTATISKGSSLRSTLHCRARPQTWSIQIPSCRCDCRGSLCKTDHHRDPPIDCRNRCNRCHIPWWPVSTPRYPSMHCWVWRTLLPAKWWCVHISCKLDSGPSMERCSILPLPSQCDWPTSVGSHCLWKRTRLHSGCLSHPAHHTRYTWW